MSFAPVQGGSSLILAFNGQQHLSADASRPKQKVLIVGTGRLAALRAFACLEADFAVLLAHHPDATLDPELAFRIHQGQLQSQACAEDTQLLRLISEAQHDNYTGARFSFALVTDTLSLQSKRSQDSSQRLSWHCRSLRLPVSIADQPHLSDFTFPSTHRFSLLDQPESKSSLQLSIATNSSACRLATRIKRQAVAALPKEVGQAVDRISQARKVLKQQRDTSTNRVKGQAVEEAEAEEEAEEHGSSQNINRPVPQRSRSTADASFAQLDTQARLRFVAQMSEYWPLNKLAALTPADLSRVLELHQEEEGTNASRPALPSRHSLDLPPLPPPTQRRGQIILIGAGTGSPALLTRAAHRLLTSQATLILSDKLVPSEVLALIPPHIPLVIAKKFPGNAEGAQSELISQSIAAAQRGETVVRLKQGDVFLYGRGGEEVLAFRQAGFEPLVLPGLSSVLAGPTMAGIPVTQRGVAESMMVCTGVGRGGKGVKLPPYERARTLVVLMGVARLASVVETLTAQSPTDNIPELSEARQGGAAYPPHCPIAIIERASSPDQRVIASTLDRIVDVMQQIGEQRPPAMMVIGWAVLALDGPGDMSVLDDAEREEDLDQLDRTRIDRWLAGRSHIIRDGLPDGWQSSIEEMFT